MEDIRSEQEHQAEAGLGDAQSSEPPADREMLRDQDPERSESDPEAIENDPSEEPDDDRLKDIKGG